MSKGLSPSQLSNLFLITLESCVIRSLSKEVSFSLDPAQEKNPENKNEINKMSVRTRKNSSNPKQSKPKKIPKLSEDIRSNSLTPSSITRTCITKNKIKLKPEIKMSKVKPNKTSKKRKPRIKIYSLEIC